MIPFKIRNIEINPPLILSPMAGVTDFTLWVLQAAAVI